MVIKMVKSLLIEQNGYQNGKIVVDRTAPDFDNLVDNSEDFAVSLGVTDSAFAYVELINQDTGRVIKEERYWTSFSLEGTWTAQVFDKAGNASAVYTFTIKPLVATAVINGQNVNFSSYTELFNAIPGININEINPKSTSNINKIPNFDKKNILRVFKAEIYGDINGSNYVKSFRWIKN